MHHMIKKQLIVEVLESITCDMCGTTYILDPLAPDDKEVISINHTFGYRSAYFGDMVKLECDICEQCLYTLLESKGMLKHCCTSIYDDTLIKQEI